MAHLLAIVFFAGLLVILAVILEQLVKGSSTQIVAALKGSPEASVRPSTRPAARPAAA